MLGFTATGRPVTVGFKPTLGWLSAFLVSGYNGCRTPIEIAMPTFSIPGGSGPLHVVDLREESPAPSSGSLPIVFVHGMVTHTGVWNAALAACADRRRAVAFDLRGHGNSAPPRDGVYSVQGCADDVLAVLDALGLQAVVLVGHSYGAFIALEAAARRPATVRRLILVDSAGDFTRLSTEEREGQIVPFMKAIEGPDWRAAVDTTFDQALAGSTMGTAASVRARLATMPHDAIVSIYRSMMTFGAVAALEQYLAQPGTSVHAILAPANAWPFSLHVLEPRIRTIVVPNVGHWIMLDAPEAFVAALETAIAGT